MEPTKTTDEVLALTAKLKAPLTAFLQERLKDAGNLVDQLRIVGHLAQALVDMSNNELRALKLQDEQEQKAAIRVYQ